jgi:hypothetical protein
MPTSPVLVQATTTVELSIVMPCLNEVSTIGTCIAKAQSYLDASRVSGEIVVADNGSTDGSIEVVRRSGARLIEVSTRGYGSALRAGISHSLGRYVIMGDADDSYDFTDLGPFLEALRDGADLVVGNRFLGGIEPGAMPPLHRYLGNPLLSFIGRRLFKIRIGDFHCGLRGCAREAIEQLELTTTGMEFASEMIVRAQLGGLHIREVPTTLSPDGRPGRSHLRTMSDGWRHLLFLFLYCPQWLFFVPGLILIAIGLGAGIPTALGPVRVGHVQFDVDTLAMAAASLLIGTQAVQFGLLANVYGARMRLFSDRMAPGRLFGRLTMGRVSVLAGLLVCAGLTGVVLSVLHWQHAGFGVLDTRRQIRLVIPSITALVLGPQLILGRLFMGLVGAEFSDNP